MTAFFSGKPIFDTPVTGGLKDPAGLWMFASSTGDANQAEVNQPNIPNGPMTAGCRSAAGIAAATPCILGDRARMELLNILTDDQVALIGCILALTVCGTVMSSSFYLGQFLHRSRTRQLAKQQARLPHGVSTRHLADPHGNPRDKAA